MSDPGIKDRGIEEGLIRLACFSSALHAIVNIENLDFGAVVPIDSDVRLAHNMEGIEYAIEMSAFDPKKTQVESIKLGAQHRASFG